MSVLALPPGGVMRVIGTKVGGALAALVLWSAHLVIAVADAPEDASAAAQRHHDRGNLSAAVIELKNALRADPNDAEARYRLGAIQLQLGDGAAAHKELLRARELGREGLAPFLARSLLLQDEHQRVLDEFPPDSTLPPSEQALLYAVRGDAHMALDDADAAAASYAIALDIVSEQPDALLGQARLAMRNGEADIARTKLRAALAVRPGFAAAWLQLARIEAAANDAAAAAPAFGKAIEYAQPDFGPRIQRAMFFIEQGDYDAAQEDIEMLRMRHEGHPAIAHLQGRVAFHTGRFDRAHEHFERAGGVPAFQRELPFYRGASALATGQYEQARDLLGRFLDANPDSSSAARLLARARLATGDAAGAEELLTRLLLEDPENADALRLMARIRERQSDADGAAAYRRRLAVLEPDDPMLAADLGLSLVKGDDDAVVEGLEILQTALRQEPDNLMADIGIVSALLRKGQGEAALSAAESMAEKYPDNGAPWALAGIARGTLGDLDGAQRAFEQALVLAPGEPSTAANLAAIALKQGRVDDARGYYEQALGQRPQHEQTLLKLAQLEARLGNDQAAETLLEQAIKAHPQRLAPQFALVGFYRDRGRVEEALLRLKRIQDAFSADPLYWSVLAVLQLSSGAPQAAVASLNRRIELEPAEAAAHLQLANAYAAAGDDAGFGVALFKALELRPDHPAASRLVEYFLGRAKDAESRVARMERIRALAPDRVELILADAAEALRQNRPASAEAYLHKAAKRVPHDPRLPLELARVQLKTGRPADALATLEAAARDIPGNARMLMVLAELQLASGRAADGKANLMKAAELAPKNAQVRNNLAWLLRQDDPDQALTLARQAVELSERREPSYLDTLGMILLQSGDAQAAQAALLGAVSIAPANATFQYHYALALEGAGSRDRARRVLLQLLSQAHDFPERTQAEALVERLR
ncbi:hypothetical protein CKO31_05485 [Thiohalocapsa halophila]|uniref:PEP-CTERM system TPR-repeat protein PrsT n=2 Tax=Thiohalocapsa halophila TaxID=69359 RepID=A0ABS1CFC1_9GAMM|nr:hypothetical protein [Thiohalocapsa halophila]